MSRVPNPKFRTPNPDYRFSHLSAFICSIRLIRVLITRPCHCSLVTVYCSLFTVHCSLSICPISVIRVLFTRQLRSIIKTPKTQYLIPSPESHVPNPEFRVPSSEFRVPTSVLCPHTISHSFSISILSNGEFTLLNSGTIAFIAATFVISS